MMCISPNTAIRHKLILLLFLLGSISYAQETVVIDTVGSVNQLLDANITITGDERPSECFEYSGYVVNKKTGNPIGDATVTVLNSVRELVTTIKTDQTGSYSFKMPCNGKNTLVISAQAYSREIRVVSTGKHPKAPSTNNRIYLTPFDSLIEKEGNVEKIKIDPIYFESNNPTSDNWDKNTLKKVLYTMLKFPEIRIKIVSRSKTGDSDIAKAVNSYFRAKAARRYLISQGIDPNRIESANGYGIGRSGNDCVNDSDCKDQESIDNSHSDFIIVSN